MSAAVIVAREPPNLPMGVRTAERMKTSCKPASRENQSNIRFDATGHLLDSSAILCVSRCNAYYEQNLKTRRSQRRSAEFAEKSAAIRGLRLNLNLHELHLRNQLCGRGVEGARPRLCLGGGGARAT